MEQFTSSGVKLTVFNDESCPIDYASYNSREPNCNVKCHSHNFTQIIYVIEGELSVHAEKEYICQKGDVAIIPDGVVHSIYSEKGYKELLIGFKPEFTGDDLHKQICSITSITKETMPDLLSTVSDTVKWFDKLSIIARDIILTYLNLFLLLVSHNLSDRQSSNFVKKLSDYLDSSLDREPSITEIANIFFISVSHLQRLCHQHFGMGVKSLYNKKRYAHSCSLLTGSDMTAKEIGEAIGFSSAANFSAFFKKHSGMTPVAYRKNNLK